MIVVTGGAGFIGSCLIWKLNQMGHEDILVVDELATDEKWKNLVGLKFLDYTEKDDFLHSIAEEGLEPGVKAVFHLGACSSTTEKDASYLVHNNFEYTKILAACALEQKARFIYASSAATYGDGEKGYSDSHEAVPGLLPLNAYAFSKQVFDQWALRNGMLNHIVGLKYFNVYGPNEWHKGDMRSMVCKGYEQIRDHGKVRLFKSDHPDYTDGGQLRDFVYVKDAVDMTVFFMDKPELNGIYNVGTGQAQDWNTLIGAIFKAMNLPPNIEYIDMPEHLKGKYQYFTQAEMDKIRKAGYDNPITSLEECVVDYVQNYLRPDKHLGGVGR